MMRRLRRLPLMGSLLIGLVAMLVAATSHAKPTGPSCVVRGHTPVKANTTVFDKPTGGTAIATLTGAKVPLRLSSFQASSLSGSSGKTGRVKLSTSGKKGYVRVDGWADVSAFRFFAAVDIAVAGRHVWITKGQQLELGGVHGDKLEVVHKLVGSRNQTLSAKVDCSSLSLEIPKPDVVDAPKRAQTYQMKSDALDLYDGPRGEPVFTLRMAEGARKVFWSTKARAGFVHVMSQSDVTIDGWVRWRDISRLGKHAEIFDPSFTAPRPWPIKKLTLQDPPKALVATAALPIHAKPSATSGAIGAIEVGARFFAMEISGQWTNIMPENLGVLPPDGGGFWVLRSTLPKARP